MAALKMDRSRAGELIERYIDAGNGLLATAHSIRDEPAYDAWSVQRKRWVRTTREGLGTIYVDPDRGPDFESAVTLAVSVSSGANAWIQDFEWDCRYVLAGVNILGSMNEALEFDEEPAGSLGDEAA